MTVTSTVSVGGGIPRLLRGVTAMISSGEMTVKLGESWPPELAPPNRTAETFSKPLPTIVTVVPPFASPCSGVTLEIWVLPARWGRRERGGGRVAGELSGPDHLFAFGVVAADLRDDAFAGFPVFPGLISVNPGAPPLASVTF